ncbi:MAG: hypothetical protein AABY64_00195 [Bdellovibrionota bacterium]
MNKSINLKNLHELLSQVLIWAICSLLFIPAHAGVIHVNEWESKPGAPWSYGGAKTDIDCEIPRSPSGGCSFKITYPAGTYQTSFSAGRVEYSLSGEPMDLYLGAWMRYSNPFTFHPNGHKANFFILAGPNPGCRNVSMGYGGLILGMTPQICWGIKTKAYDQRLFSWDPNAHLGEWHWYEGRVKVNTPGLADGVMQIWIDDKPYLNYTNIPFRDVGDNRGFGAIQHTGEWGGGGGTIPKTGYWWIDHTVISTTRIGMPGGASIPLPLPRPTPPKNLRPL